MKFAEPHQVKSTDSNTKIKIDSEPSIQDMASAFLTIPMNKKPASLKKPNQPAQKRNCSNTFDIANPVVNEKPKSKPSKRPFKKIEDPKTLSKDQNDSGSSIFKSSHKSKSSLKSKSSIKSKGSPKHLSSKQIEINRRKILGTDDTTY